MADAISKMMDRHSRYGGLFKVTFKVNTVYGGLFKVTFNTITTPAKVLEHPFEVKKK